MKVPFWWKQMSRQKRFSGRAPLRASVCFEQQKAAHNVCVLIRNILIISFILFPLGFSLSGCTPKYGRHDPDRKQALRTLAGGVAGVLIAGNTGGAIVGALVIDIVSVATIRYEDTHLENGDQAAKKYKDLERKAEEKKDQEKKAEERKDQEKKAEKRRFEEKRVKLIIEDASVATHAVISGATVKANIQYTLLAPEGTENVRITESRKIWTAYSTFELDTRDIIRTQGTYRSSIQFTMPDDIPRGYCILYTTVSDGRQVKTARSIMNIL